MSEAADGVEAVYEPYQVETKRSVASWVACFKVEVAADIVRGMRPHEAQLLQQRAKKKAQKAHRDGKCTAVKGKVIAAVDRRVKQKAAEAS